MVFIMGSWEHVIRFRLQASWKQFTIGGGGLKIHISDYVCQGFGGRAGGGEGGWGTHFPII